jgi:hypothetical protein
VKPELHAQLREQADANGVSVTEEINELLRKGLSAPSFAPSTEGILVLLGEAMKAAGESSLFALTQSWDLARERDWIDDPYAYDHAMKAAITVLQAFKPEGKARPPEIDTPWSGEFWGRRVLKMAATGEPNVPEATDHARKLHHAAGRLAARIGAWLEGSK